MPSMKEVIVYFIGASIADFFNKFKPRNTNLLKNLMPPRKLKKIVIKWLENKK